MKYCGKVQGSKKFAQELIVDVDTVYVHSNIVLISKDDQLFEYDEVQYSKDEYIKLMAEENKELNERLVSTQSALCEIYENMNN